MKWQYTIMRISTSDTPIENWQRQMEELDGYGNTGWEEVSGWYVDGYSCILLKRPISR